MLAVTGLAGLLLLSPLKQVRLILQVASPAMKNDRKSDESIDNLIYILYVSDCYGYQEICVSTLIFT